MNNDKNKIKNNLYDLYAMYNQYKLLFNFWKQNQSMKTRDEIMDRFNYIKKNKINQRNELETLMWVIGEDKKHEFNY